MNSRLDWMTGESSDAAKPFATDLDVGSLYKALLGVGMESCEKSIDLCF